MRYSDSIYRQAFPEVKPVVKTVVESVVPTMEQVEDVQQVNTMVADQDEVLEVEREFVDERNDADDNTAD